MVQIAASRDGIADGQGARRVLVVEDEEPIADLLRMALRYEGFDVDVAESGSSAVEIAHETTPHLVLLDVMLPDLDGFEVLARLFGLGLEMPVIFLTARDGTEDRLHGLALGADDYICKPFSLAEVIARVHLALRRTIRGQAAGKLQYADLVIDQETLEVTRDGQLIELTPTEYRLLSFLIVNARRVLSKRQILEHVWDYDFNGDPNIVETYISYLRKKVDCYEPPLIQTVRGFGYSLRLPRS
jgi:two-component system OmpR family response regulator